MPRAPKQPLTPRGQAALEWAADEYDRRRRGVHRPLGSSDRARRWTPTADEQRACCNLVRLPSRAYPWSLWSHCHTAVHIAALADNPEVTARRIVLERRRRLQAGAA